ncbi:Glucose-induced degradation protein 8 [Wickerhamiella sorbophila]|uniref:Glucose-induced degradation protein 8 n=1 Tax=Wickerhamiella sorbophila TaxID=45607 RepID=A0A2T0FK61_9ASCO|nr:Glucose-induced degradation protein 8 [Wickerhamiella sorbophila]PRT55368.1 Glucose-induced degradation protein 8 [Wickerhamiella sorbophila]
MVSSPYSQPVAAAMFEIGARYDILAAIYEHFVTTANYDAARVFASEAAVPNPELGMVLVRHEVKRDIEGGRIEAALETLQQEYPAIVEEQSALLFELKLMQLIELIRASDFDADPASIDPALEYARAQALPLVKLDQAEDAKRMVQLQKVMALVCIDASKGLPTVLEELLDQRTRDELAVRVNGEMLKCHGSKEMSRLESLRLLRDMLRKSVCSASCNDYRVEGIDFVEL